MKQVYLVRHAESEGNAGPLQQDGTTPLSERGHAQKSLVAGRFRSIPIDRLISSPFERAKDTAEAIAAVLGKEIEYSDLFIERKRPSAIAGLPKDSPEWHAIQDPINANYHDLSWRHSDEENFLALRARAVACLAHIQSLPEERILIVTHGFFMSMLVAVALFGNEVTSHVFEDFFYGAVHDNTGITVLKESKHEDQPVRFKLITWNDCAHLGE